MGRSRVRSLDAVVENGDACIVEIAVIATLARYGDYRRITGRNSNAENPVRTKVVSSDEELLTRSHPNLPLVSECCGMLALFGLAGFVAGAIRFRQMEYR